MWEEYKNAETAKQTLCCTAAHFMHLETDASSPFLTSVTIAMES